MDRAFVKGQFDKRNSWDTFREVISHGNLLISFANVFFFIVIEVAFFWFILSGQLTLIIEDKVGIATEMTKASDSFRVSVDEYLDSPEATIDIPKKAAEQTASRKDTNLDLMKQSLLPVVAFLGIIVLYQLGRVIALGAFSYEQKVLLFFVVGAFSTELVYYFAIIRRWKFIGDMELLEATVTPSLDYMTGITGGGFPPGP